MGNPICEVLHDTLTPIAARRGDWVVWYDAALAVYRVVHGELRVIRRDDCDDDAVVHALRQQVIAPASSEHAARLARRLQALSVRAAS
jgi:hypothetical protein